VVWRRSRHTTPPSSAARLPEQLQLFVVSMDQQTSMKTLQAIESEIIETFEALDTVDEKYAYLFNLGDNLPPMDLALKTDENQVKGCQSSLWFNLKQEDGCFYLEADSDSMVIKGISALLVRLVEGRTAEEVLQINMDFIDKIQIWKLASERNNGLMAMLDHIHQAARTSDLQNSLKEDKFTSS
jgi:cysteine desulfuration protein SufE